MRVIVFFDPTNKNLVHEYRNSGKRLLCLGCHVMKKNVSAPRCNEESPNFFIPRNEEHCCQPRMYDDIRELQKSYAKKGNKRKRSDDGTHKDSIDEEFSNAKKTRKSATVIEWVFVAVKKKYN